MATAASLMVKVGADVSNFKKKMEGASSKLSSVGKSMTATGKSLSTKVTAPILGIGAAAVSVGTKFESQMSKVQAISGATGEDMSAMREQAKQLGADTAFSARQAGEGMQFLSQAGFETTETIEAMPAVLDLAAASETELGNAADITSNIMGGFSLEAEEASRTADVLAKSSSIANTNVDQMGKAMSFVAPVANNLGVSMEETSAAIGVLADSGIQAGKAGRTLRSSMTRLVKPSKEAKGVMKDIGFEATNQQGEFKNLSTIVGDFNKATQDMTKAQRANAVATVFGTEASSGMLKLLEAGQGDIDSFSQKLRNSEGTAKSMAQTMMDNLGGSLTSLRGSLETLAIEFSEVIAPSLKKVVDRVKEGVNWFSNLDDGTKRTIAVIGGIASAIGPVLVVLGTLVTSLGSIVGAVGTLTTVIGGIGFVPFVTAVTGAISAGKLLLNNWKTVKSTAKSIFPAIRENIVSVFNRIQSFISSNASTVKDVLMATWKAASETALNVWTALFAGLKPIVNDIANLLSAMGEKALPKIKTAIIAIQEFVLDNVRAIKTFIDNNADVITNTLVSGWNKIKSVTNTVFPVIRKTVVTATNKIVSVLSAMGEKVLPKIRTAFNAIKKFITSTFTTVKDFLQSNSEVITNDLVSSWDKINVRISSVLNTLRNTFKTVFNNIRNFIDKHETQVKTALGEVWSLISDVLVANFKEIRNNLKNSFNEMKPAILGFEDTARELMPAFKQIGRLLIKTLEDVASALALFLEVAKSVINGVINALPEVVKTFRSVVETIVNLVGAISALMRGDYSAAWDLAIKTVKSAVEVIMNTGEVLLEFIEGFAKSVMATFKGLGVNIPKLVNTMLTDIKEYFNSRLGDIIKTVNKWSEKVGGAFGKLKKLLVGGSIVPDMVDGVADSVGNMDDKVTGEVSDMVSDTTQSFKDMGKKAKDKVSNFTSDVITNFTDFGFTTNKKVESLVSDTVDGFNLMDTKVGKTITSLKDGSVKKIKKFSKSAGNVFRSLKNDNVSTLETLSTEGLAAFTFLDKKSAKVVTEMGKALIKKVGNLASDLAGGLKDLAEEVWKGIKDVIGSAVDAVLSPIKTVKEAISGVVEGAKNIGSDIIGGAKGIAESVGGFLGFQEGGIVREPTLGVVGEAGPEAVIPLDKMEDMGGSGGNEINVEQNFRVMSDPEDVRRESERALRKLSLEWGVADGRIL